MRYRSFEPGLHVRGGGPTLGGLESRVTALHLKLDSKVICVRS
jgi:hypothetical protein